MTINELKRLAGITEKKEDSGMNMSYTGTEKARLMRKYDIKPGTEEWFKLWFSLPYMTGEKPISRK
jgi:hypothetical protein